MDISTLHTLTEDLAAFLSEATHGDLHLPVLSISGDLGDLYVHLVERNERLVTSEAAGTAAGGVVLLGVALLPRRLRRRHTPS